MFFNGRKNKDEKKNYSFMSYGDSELFIYGLRKIGGFIRDCGNLDGYGGRGY